MSACVASAGIETRSRSALAPERCLCTLKASRRRRDTHSQPRPRRARRFRRAGPEPRASCRFRSRFKAVSGNAAHINEIVETSLDEPGFLSSGLLPLISTEGRPFVVSPRRPSIEGTRRIQASPARRPIHGSMARPLPKQPRNDEETPPEPKLEVVPDPASLDEPVEVEEKDPYDAGRGGHAGSAEALRPPDRRRPAPDAGRGARARPAQGRGRRGGEAPADRVQPAPRDVDHAQLHEGRRAAARPDPGGQPRADPRRREVRLQARLQALDLRDLVDSAGRHAGRSPTRGARSACRSTSPSRPARCSARGASSPRS